MDQRQKLGITRLNGDAVNDYILVANTGNFQRKEKIISRNYDIF